MSDGIYYNDVYSKAVQMLITIAIFALIMCLAVVVGLMGIFRKADKPAWAAFVPFYNAYLLNEIAFGNGFIFLIGLLPGVAKLFHLDSSVTLLFAIINFIYNIFLCNRLSTVFDRSKLFTVGLLFLPFIFYPILGFGSAYYCGLYASGGSFLSTGRSKESFQSEYYTRDYRKNPVQNSYETYTGNRDSYAQNNSVNYGVSAQIRTDGSSSGFYSQNDNSADAFYGQSGDTVNNDYGTSENSAENDSFYGNSSSDYGFGGTYSQNASSYNSDGYYGQNSTSNENSGYYGQNSTSNENSGYYGQNSTSNENSSYYGQNSTNNNNSGYYGQGSSSFGDGGYYGQNNR